MYVTADFKCTVLVVVTELTVDQRGVWEEIVPVLGSFGVQCSVAPTRKQKVMSRV